jgi:hypothetical protein
MIRRGVREVGFQHNKLRSKEGAFRTQLAVLSPGFAMLLMELGFSSDYPEKLDSGPPRPGFRPADAGLSSEKFEVQQSTLC